MTSKEANQAYRDRAKARKLPGQCSRPSCQETAAEGKKMCQRHIDYHREYERKNAKRSSAHRNARRKSEFLRAVSHYGGKCLRCGDKDPLHLQLHHTNGDGHKDRRENPEGWGGNFYRWLETHGWPDNVELICANCHLAHHRTHGFK